MTGRAGPRLLFVVNNPAFFISHRLEVGRAALAAGYDVHVASPGGPGTSDVLAAGMRHHVVRLTRRGQNPLAEGAALASLVRLYRRLRPDVVHHVTVKPVLYGSLAARIAGVPAVVNAVSGLGYLFIKQGAAARLRRTAVLATYRLAFSHPCLATIFQNDDDARVFLDRGLLRQDQVRMIRGSGVDLAAFAPAPEPAGVPRVVLPARLLWDKGVGEFVRAAELLRDAGVAVRCVLVGETDPGNPAAISETQLEAWRRGGAVELAGFRADIASVLRDAAVVCLPSYREGLPKALVEGCAAGRALVATDVPGCRDVVEDGGNGLLVPPRDAEGLADAIRRLVERPEERRRMGARARVLAEERYDVRAVAAATLEVYRSLSVPQAPAAAASYTSREAGARASAPPADPPPRPAVSPSRPSDP